MSFVSPFKKSGMISNPGMVLVETFCIFFFRTFMDVIAGMYPFFFVDKNHVLSKMDHTELGVGATLENSVASCHLLLV